VEEMKGELPGSSRYFGNCLIHEDLTACFGPVFCTLIKISGIIPTKSQKVKTIFFILSE
jgi:hypothetical protein